MTSERSSRIAISPGEPVLRSKLFVPQPRPGFIPRERLVSRLLTGANASLILISAPAGFGKTTLLTEWIAKARQTTAWLALDAADNDPIRFFTYVVTAINQAAPGLGMESLALLQAPQPPVTQTLITLLLADLEKQAHTIHLILDDYQVISNPKIHEGLVYLLDHLPQQLRLVMATRADPPIPLARLRARGELCELRLADLRFTGEETSAFLNESMELDLAVEDIWVLEVRTEGWIAGLQLAALSLQQNTERSAFIRAFSGSNRYILDYLGEEVLGQQPEHIQQFLLETSILERLCGSLCDALLGGTDSQSILEYLDQSNLFLIPLDDERKWYRYHHLFADLLQARLRRQVGETEISRLHREAAQWYEANHDAKQAINHALAGGDLERAAHIVERNTLTLLTHGELAPLLAWIKSLPDSLVSERPWLCVEQGWALAFSGQLAAAEALLVQAEKVAAGKELQRLHGHITAQRGYLALTLQQDARAIELANRASHILPENDYWVRTVVEWTRGYILRAMGDLDGAAQAFNEQIHLAHACDNVWAYLMAVYDLAAVYRIQGQLNRAAELFQEALTSERVRKLGNLSYAGRVEAGFASVRYEQNQLEEAIQLIRSSIEKNHLWQNPNHILLSQAIHARILIALGDIQGAQEALRQALEIQNRTPIVRTVTTLIQTIQARLWFLRGDLDAVDEWLLLGESPHANNPENREPQHIIRARWLVYRGQEKEAISRLEELEQSAGQDGRVSSWIEIQGLLAVAHHASGDIAQACAALDRALARGAQDGFMRVFLDEGEPMRHLLVEYRTLRMGQSPQLVAYTNRLLDAFAAEKSILRIPEPAKAAIAKTPLVEPLSEREIEVLRSLAGGLSYQEIARQLVVAHGTVKVHVHNIYEKLNAANRTQAISIARELGLI